MIICHLSPALLCARACMGHQKMKAVHVNGQDVAVRLGRQRTTSTTVVMGRYTENTEPLSDI